MAARARKDPLLMLELRDDAFDVALPGCRAVDAESSRLMRKDARA